MTFAKDVQAVDWRFTPYVGTAATLTDNVNQSENDPQRALILSVTPGFGLRAEGSRRVQASMNYGLTGVARFGDDTTTDLYHNLAALGKAELIEDFLYVDGSANISQELISLFGSQADANTNDSNRATLGSYSLSPYIQKRLGTFATAQARYTNGGAIFGRNAASDAVTNAFNASLISGPRFNDLNWGLDYSIRQSNYEGSSSESTFERATLTLGYALTRKFRVFGTYGEESNDFLNVNNASGSSYSVGFGWAPSRRTSVEASIGERYFGRTYSFIGRHQTRASIWSVRYSEDISDTSQRVTNYDDLQSISAVCPAGTVLPPKATGADALKMGCSVNLLFGTSLQNGVFILKLLSADVTWTKGRLGLGLTAFDTTRVYQGVADAEDRTQGISGRIDYRLTPRTSANTSLSLSRNSATAVLLQGPARQDDLFTLNLGLNHRFGKDFSGALTFRHQQRDSNIVGSDYSENSLTASANLSF